MISTASIDNINLEIKSSLTTTLLNGTAASINQQPTDCHLGTYWEVLSLIDSSKKLQDLSQWYTDVAPFYLLNEITVLLLAPSVLAPTAPPIVTSGTVSMYQLWLDNQNSSSWALLHSQVKILKLPQHQDMSVILPLWQEDSKSPSTVKHLLNVLIQTISYLNLGQIAAVKLNQPLYVIAKRIQ